jgi:hypothetical protein
MLLLTDVVLCPSLCGMPRRLLHSVLGAVAGFLTVLVVCSCATGPEVVAQVGETAITAEDVAYRQAVLGVRSGEEMAAHLALFQLLEEALMAEVGREWDVVVSEEMLADEAARVEASSRDPETLACIRAVFGQDEAAYRRLVLKPTLVNQMLHARFSLGHDIQAEPLARAKELLSAAQADPASLPALAEAFGGTYRELRVVDGRIHHGDGQDEAPPSALAGYDVEWPDYDRTFVEQVLAGLVVGELHPRVVEDRQSFMVVQLLSQENGGDDALVASAYIAKLAFAPWFQAQSQRVPLVVSDRALKEALLAEVEVPYITARLSEDE